jgi:hypothetical protein
MSLKKTSNPKLRKDKNTKYFPSIQIYATQTVGWVLYQLLFPTCTGGA